MFWNTSLGPDAQIATAIEMPRKHQIVWQTPAGPGLVLRSDIVDSSAYGTSSLLFSGGTGSAVMQVLLSGELALQLDLQTGGTDNNPNSIHMSSAKTGVTPVIGVSGTEANIGLVLNPKGTGQIVIGGVGSLNVAGMPTSCTGFPGGTLWNSSGTVHICP